jgi:hypothetical protein
MFRVLRCVEENNGARLSEPLVCWVVVVRRSLDDDFIHSNGWGGGRIRNCLQLRGIIFVQFLMSTHMSFLCSIIGRLDRISRNSSSRLYCMYVPLFASMCFSQLNHWSTLRHIYRYLYMNVFILLLFVRLSIIF